jgi:hypothetical protein
LESHEEVVPPAEAYTQSNHRPSVKLARIPTAPTAITSGEEKPCKTAHFQAVDPRSVFVVAGGNHPLAVDNQQQYRPREIPANCHIEDYAGDAVGTLQRLSSTFSSLS